MVVVNCGKAFSRASWARQSNPRAQYSASGRRVDQMAKANAEETYSYE